MIRLCCVVKYVQSHCYDLPRVLKGCYTDAYSQETAGSSPPPPSPAEAGSPDSINSMAVTVAELDLGLCTQGAPPIPVAELTIASARQALWTGAINCTTLVRSYIERIAAYDQKTGLNAVLRLNDAALHQAARLDADLVHARTLSSSETTAAEAPLSSLFCVPLLVKDNYDVAGLPTTAGSVGLKGNYPSTDAHVIAKLRKAGAIMLAKANMGELAFFPSFCISSIGGVVRNPYDLGFTPAGSSGGSAAGCSAGFAIAALGTDTGDSVRGPASHAGLVGMRPSLGLVGRSGIVPLRFDRDAAGPLTRSVSDAATLLSEMAGYDAGDNLTSVLLSMPTSQLDTNFMGALNASALVGARIGVFRSIVNIPGTDIEISSLFNQALYDLKAAGAELIDNFKIVGNSYGRDWDANRYGEGPALGFWNVQGVWQDLWACQSPLRMGFDEYMSNTSQNISLRPDWEVPPPRTLNELYSSKLYHPAVLNDLGVAASYPAPQSEFRTAPANGIPPNASLNILQGDGCGCGTLETDYCRVEFRKRLIESMDTLNVDVVVYPTWNYPPLRIGNPGDGYYDGNTSPMIAPHVGAPALTVPMGKTSLGLPTGLQILGRPFADATVLRIGYAYEQATSHRSPPALFRECITEQTKVPQSEQRAEMAAG